MKPGYKHTEAGVIPEDWDAVPLGNFIALQRGHDLTWRSRKEGDVPVMGSAGQNGFHSIALSKGPGVVLGRSGASFGQAHYCEQDFWPHNTTLYVTDFRGNEPLFVFYLLRSIDFSRHNSGGAQQSLNRNFIAPIKVGVPHAREQRDIVLALSDVDELLAGLNRLLAKKRDLKHAAMQQLLSGQTRLHGFDGKWKVKPLKQAADITTGINKPLSEMGSGALYVTVQDLYDGTSIRTGRLGRIKISQTEVEAKSLVVGDIVFGKSSVKREGIGYPSQFLGCGEPVVFSGFTYRARARQGITDAAFLFYALRTEKTRRWLIDNSQSSALTNINQTIADAIPIELPPTVPEQTAIAEVLTEMDAELAVLEQRREKTYALKQAMMQELLTGKTRLI